MLEHQPLHTTRSAVLALRGQGFGPGIGPGMMRGYGPPVDETGQIDTSKLPAWCPYASKPDIAPKTE